MPTIPTFFVRFDCEREREREREDVVAKDGETRERAYGERARGRQRQRVAPAVDDRNELVEARENSKHPLAAKRGHPRRPARASHQRTLALIH